MANEYSINAKITADSTDFQEAVKKASKSLDGMKDSFNKATQNIKKSVADWGLDIDKFYYKGSKIFKDFGIDIDKFAAHFGTTGKVVAAITTASIALTKFGQSMNEARAEIAKGTGAVGEDLIKLQDTLHKVMIEGVGRDAKEVGGMMADLNTRFGATEKELVDMTVQFDKFSAVMGVDARQAINDTADVMAKWGIETKDLNPLLDQLTTAAQMSGASINELTSGLKQGQSVFSQFGMSATDSIAILSSLAKNGIETNSAITALKYSLNVFSKAGIDAKTGLNDTIEAITNAKTETEALSVACEVFGARNGVEMVKVLKSGSMSADEFKTALMNAGGVLSSVDRASRTSVDAIEDLKSVLAGTFAGFGEGFDNIFKDLLDSIKDVIQFVAPAIEPIGNIFRDVATAIGEMLRVLVENFIEFEKRYNVVFKAVVNVLKTAYEIIHKVLGNILEAFKTSFSLIFAILDGKWGLAWENAKKLALLFAKNLADILSGIVDLFSKMMNGIIEKINSAIDLYHKLPKAVQIFDIGTLDKISEKVDFASKWKITEKLKEVQQEIDKLSGKTTEKVIGDLGKVKTVTEEVADGIKGQSMEVAQFNQDLASNQKGFFDTWAKQYEDLAGNWNKTFTDMANVGTQAMGDIFETVGKSLADDSVAFEDYSAVAVEAISKVLKALSAQLSAEAAVAAAHYDYGTAAMAAAGAAAALVAAGTLSAVASNMKKTSDAAKEASSSLEEFKKRLAEIWSGATSTSGFVSSLVQMNSVVETTRANVEKAQKAYRDLYTSQKDYVQKVWNTYFNGSLYGGWGYEIYEGFYKLKKSYGELTLELEKYKESLKTLEESRGKFIQQQEESIETTRLEIKAYEDLYSSIFKLKGVSDDYTNVLNANVKILKNEIFSKLQEEVKSLYSSLINIGSDLGKSITDGIKNGVTKSDFMETVKEYIKNKVIELVVYTDEFNSQLAEIGTKLASAIASGLPNEIAKATKQIEKLYESASTAAKKASDAIDEANKKISNSLSERLKKSIENIQETFKQKIEAIAQQAKEAAKKAEEELKAKYEEIGSSLGQTLINSLVNGAKKEDFSKELGNYFKNQLVQVVIYTQEFTEKMTVFGEKIYKALMSGNQISVIKLKSEIEKYFSTKQSEIKVMSDFINSLFGLEVKENISSGADTIVENVSKIQKAIDSLKDTLADLGGDVAGNFISSLNSGLDLDSALISFKKFIRNYVIQSAVYTDSLKSEMEKIGQGIADYIMGKNGGLEKISNEFKKTYEKLATGISKTDEYLDKIFGKEKKEEIKDTGSTITKELSKIESAMDSFKKTVSDLGGDVASNFISSLSGGLDVKSALLSFKNFIRNYVVKASVYTESLKEEFEKIGLRVWHYVSGSYPKSELNNIKKEASSIYGNLAESLKGVDEVLDEIFGKEEVTKELSKIESAMDSFKKTVSDLGGDIASNLIDGLSNGLSQSDFLSNMKDWIKKMLVQSVVYTEQMKAQIEAIGKAISNAISGGFTETSMHEIRRDLSFIFEQASSKMSGIDKILGGVFDGYASGTTSALSGLHIVGERGPELVRFNGGERVYNNADTMRMIAGAGKTNNFNVTFNNLQDTSAFAMMSQLKQYNREMAINGIL